MYTPEAAVTTANDVPTEAPGRDEGAPAAQAVRPIRLKRGRLSGTGSSASPGLDPRAAAGSGAGRRERVGALAMSIMEAEAWALELHSSSSEVSFNL